MLIRTTKQRIIKSCYSEHEIKEFFDKGRMQGHKECLEYLKKEIEKNMEECQMKGLDKLNYDKEARIIWKREYYCYYDIYEKLCNSSEQRLCGAELNSQESSDCRKATGSVSGEHNTEEDKDVQERCSQTESSPVQNPKCDRCGGHHNDKVLEILNQKKCTCAMPESNIFGCCGGAL